MGIPAAFKYALAVSRRTRVACSICRNGHPSRPNATTCSRLFGAQDIAHADEAYSAEFNVPGVIVGRFQVTAEADLGKRIALRQL